MPDNPLNFWQELKRRKVVRVIVGYLAAAYVILELTSIIAEPWGLPGWTINLVSILLIIGFVVTVIISWIFDVTPQGIKKTESAKALRGKSQHDPAKRKFKATDSIIAVLLIAVVTLAYPRIIKKDKFKDVRNEDGRITVAVMPFENLTGDTTLNWFQRGISSLLINGLGNSSELAVRDDQTMIEILGGMNQLNTAGYSLSLSKEVAKKVKAKTYISGSFQGKDDTYWILVNLVNTENGNIIGTNKVQGNLKSSAYLDMADSLCSEIRNYLEIKALEDNANFDFKEAYPKSAEAYRYFIEGMNLVINQNYESGIGSLKKALEIDSTFTFASFYIAYGYAFSTPIQFEQARLWTKEAYLYKDRIPLKYQLWIELWYACYYSKSFEDITRYCDLLVESGINTRLLWSDLGVTYVDFLDQNKKAVNAFEKVMDINLERGDDWKFLSFYDNFLWALHKTGDHDREREIAGIGLAQLPDNSNWFFYHMAICALSQGKTSEANEALVRYMAKHEELGTSEDNLERFLGQLYEEANILDQAEIHFRKALELNPRRPNNLYGLAKFLINNDTNADEGVELINKALVILPDNELLLQWLGYGYFKQGKYEEALTQLEIAEEKNLEFNYELHILIPEVKQALANQLP